VDVVASFVTRKSLFMLRALIVLNVAAGKISVDALSVQVVMFVMTVVEMVTLDADKVLTASVDTVVRSKMELET
jgi:hypothetical protein